MSNVSAPRFLSAKHAADYLGIDIQTLYNWRATKRYPIPFTRVGKLVRYRQEDLDKWLASRTEYAEESAALVTA